MSGCAANARLCILSGGQTGVDRGALDAALAVDAPCGGWCPEGRTAEDGPISSRYPLKELPGGDYAERTLMNVADSEATIVITFGPASGGTLLTIECCRQVAKPCLVIDAAATSLEVATRLAVEFVQSQAVHRLNIAGPRASGEPRGYTYAYKLVTQLLATVNQSS